MSVKDIVTAPEGASMSLEYIFHDARDPKKQVVLTAHQLNSGVVALNLWLYDAGKWLKLLKEESRPAPYRPEMLMGVFIRWLADERLRGWANSILYWYKAQQNILMQIMGLFESSAT